MGTSQSSNGSPGGVPMVPPWVPDIPFPPAPAEEAPPTPVPDQNETPDPGLPQHTAPHLPIPVAPLRRFAGASRNLGDFSRSGDAAAMRRGLGQYVKNGYGGSATATRRLGSTVQTANALYSALSGAANNPFATPGRPLDPVLIAGRSADEIMDAVVEAVRPVDGTQDAEASRAAIKDALADVLERFPDADLLDLQEEQRELAIERYVAGDVFRRFDLELGRKIYEKAPDATTALSRLKEVREYVRETVAASFRQLRDSGRQLAAGRVMQIVQSALRDAHQVFEGYAE